MRPQHEDALHRDADEPHDDRHATSRRWPEIANEHNLTLAVDNTFLSPYLQQPIELGAHIVVHSMTKYLNGHSDATGGAVILTRAADAEKIYFLQRSTGAGLAPMDCFLVSRGIKTLAVRMIAARRQRHGHRAVPGKPSQGEAGAIPGTADSSRSTTSRGGSSAASAR